MLPFNTYILLIVSFSSCALCIGPSLFRLSSNPHTDLNPSARLTSSSASSTSLSAASSALSPLSYSSDTNSYAYWNCHTIPPNMTLCKSVGYSRMVLPNFLHHESLREAIQQANVWIALVNTDCHPDIQRFLCSLYAPVCLKSHQEAKIPPCWELCNQVRNACLPRMKLFGFDWPDIVRCQQFPRLAESMCIPPREKSTAVTCVPCEQAITLENIASSYCMADVVLKASVKDMVLQPNQASITLNLTPRTLALKLIRSDGTQLSSIDQYRRKRNSRRRRNNNFSNNNQDDDGTQHVYRPRAVRNLKVNMNTDNQYQSKYLIRPKSINFNEAKNWRSELKTKTKRRRKPRNSRLHDLDGITELILSCSSCNPLIPFTSGRLASSLSNQKWLVMGRRIQDSSTKKYTNQLQITFLGLWNRESAEFRQSLNAIRKEPVAHLCNKNQATLSAVIQPQSIRYHHPGRPLKILRSAPSELSDSPNYNELHNTLSVNKPLSSLSNQNIRSQSNNFHHYYRPEKSNKLGGYYQSKQTAYYNDSEYYLNNDLNSDKFKLNNGQTNYLNETNQLQSRQKTHRSSHRERRKKWKLNSNKMPSTTNPQSYQDSNSYQYVLPINPYSD